MNAKIFGATLTAIALATSAQGQTTSPASSPRAAPLYGNLDPFYGDINAFWGDINPFYGNLDPFWGDINPFYRDISAFWGDINPFYKDISAFSTSSTPDYAHIGTFWKTIGPAWRETDKRWNDVGFFSKDPGKYEDLQIRLNALVSQSELIFGPVVTSRTGKSFREGFAVGVFAKYGVDLNNMATFQGLTQSQRSRFFLDWYDGLMAYSGADHIDYWMGTVNWSPAVTRAQGSGAGSIVGILDASLVGDADIADNIVFSGGGANRLSGHGAGVASLIVAAHDGKGLMGIAPQASVVAYNPFDGSGTASWADVTTGVLALRRAGASVINMSLGVPRWTLHQDWQSVFNNPDVAAETKATVFVIAAGNDGIIQNTNLTWNAATAPHMIVVGSVNPSGFVSEFSNRPGTACLLRSGSCLEQNRLYRRYIVAPGEAILVSDGQGGLIRRSGTSFAAPLVSGAITLLHDRWPWLAKHPAETVDIILKSAKDLGSSGPDEIYGWGLLDVEASQSPLNFSSLVFYEHRNGVVTARTTSSIRHAGVQSSWDADGVFFSMFEKIGATQRDFVVPLSSRLIGQKTSAGGSNEYFQSYATSRFTDWVRNGFSDVQTVEAPAAFGWTLRVAGSHLDFTERRTERRQLPHSSVTLADTRGRFALTTGFGQGALALNDNTGFGLVSDHSGTDGGVNPILGFASGGAFASVDVAIAPHLKLSAGLTQQRLLHADLPGLTSTERNQLYGLDAYRAGAMNVSLTQTINRRFALSATYTRLGERTGLLGVQSTADGDLRHGSTSDAGTLSATAKLDRGVTIAASATAARTRADGSGDQGLATRNGGVLSSAFALSATKTALFGERDRLRFSVAQPLHIERGALEHRSIAVVDRATGELGPVATRFSIAPSSRRYTAEMLYAAPVFDGQAEIRLFGRTDWRAGSETGLGDYIVGSRFAVVF